MTGIRLVLSVAVLMGTVTVLTGEARQYTPSQADSDNYRGKPCKDPWINIAYRLADNSSPQGVGTRGACDINRYNRGSWPNYQVLNVAIALVRSNMARAGIAERVYSTKTGYRIDVLENGVLLDHLLIGHDGATLIGQDGASLIGTGVGSLIGKGGAGIVAGGGGNIYGLQATGRVVKEIAPGVFFVKKAR